MRKTFLITIFIFLLSSAVFAGGGYTEYEQKIIIKPQQQEQMINKANNPIVIQIKKEGWSKEAIIMLLSTIGTFLLGGLGLLLRIRRKNR